MRYWFLKLKIQHGEYEFYSASLHKTNKEKFDAEAYARDFYGDPDDPDNTDGTYYCNGGELAVQVYTFEEIKKAEYNTLGKFMY